MAQLFSARVKNVLSGDTLVLVPTKTTQFPSPERLLTLSHVSANDSFESKEAMRQLLIGKEIKFKVLYKGPSREFGDVQAPVFKSLIEFALTKGWVKVSSHEDSEFVESLRQIETTAKAAGVGLWSGESDIEVVPLSESIRTQSRQTPITAIVDKVISGDRIVARLLFNKQQHGEAVVLLAGIKCPRTDDSSETVKIGHQAKQFVEDKLLSKTNIKVRFVGETQTGHPLAIIEHPSGNNIHEKLLEAGLAEVVDWQSTMLGSQVMAGLRKAEQSAKALGKGLFASAAPALAGRPALSKGLKPGSSVDNVTIAKVVNTDTLVVRLPNDEELTVQLASLRGPRPSDQTVTTNSLLQQAVVNTAKEFVRIHAIGKSGTLYVDGFRNANADLGFDARFLVSFKTTAGDLSETIVKNGWAGVIKHNKATSHERSLNWDRLIELEEEAKAAKKGIFYQGDISKIASVGTRIVDASENFTKAKTFFNGFQKKGRITGFHVEFVSAVNRIKLFNPKEGLKLTLVMGGLANERSPANEEGIALLNKRLLQRNVEFEVYDTDKIGGFIGNVFVNSKSLVPVQVLLLENGYTSIHEIAISSNKFESELTKAEQTAQNQRKGVWANYDPAKVNEAIEKLNQASLEDAKPKFFDAEVTDIDSEGAISFHLLDSATVQKFATFKKYFSDFHAQMPSASQSSTDLPFNLTRPPKKGDLVSAKYSENGKYYRARVVSFDRSTNTFEVKHLDFGNVDKVSLSSLRSLPAPFNLTAFPAFAHNCRLQSIKLPPSKPSDYLTDALYALEDLTFDKKLVISGLPSKRGVEFEAILYDSEQSLKDPDYTINKQLVSEGWGIVEPSSDPNLKQYIEGLKTSQTSAKKLHLGCWEFGDVSFDEEPL